MPHSFANMLGHLVFGTKDRRPFIDDDLRPRLFPYLGGIANESSCKPLIIGGRPDHVHLLLTMPPAVAPSDLIRVIKTNSSRWVHETWPARRDFTWQRGFGLFSVSESRSDAVKRYIAEQEAHHREMTFEEEFIALLKRHNVAYDPRYMWE